jgi:hypothetical protein
MNEPCSKCKKFIQINESTKSKVKLLRDNHNKIVSEMQKMKEAIVILKKDIKDLKDSLSKK